MNKWRDCVPRKLRERLCRCYKGNGDLESQESEQLTINCSYVKLLK